MYPSWVKFFQNIFVNYYRWLVHSFVDSLWVLRVWDHSNFIVIDFHFVSLVFVFLVPARAPGSFSRSWFPLQFQLEDVPAKKAILIATNLLKTLFMAIRMRVTTFRSLHPYVNHWHDLLKLIKPLIHYCYSMVCMYVCKVAFVDKNLFKISKITLGQRSDKSSFNVIVLTLNSFFSARK